MIPNYVTSIASSAFSKCSTLKYINIPQSVESIDDNAFEGCSGLERITVDADNTVYKSDGNCIIEKATNKLLLGCKNSVIPNYVTSIGDYAFDGCRSMTSIVIPSSVTSIGGYAFEDCSSLTSVTIPSSVTSIGNSAFRGCSSMTSIVIPSNVTRIGNNAFSRCSSLTIYCEAESEPSRWSIYWNPDNRPVVWGYKAS